MSTDSNVPVDAYEIVDIASRMAQELQDYADAAVAAGSAIAATQALVDEWESLYQRLPDGVK